MDEWLAQDAEVSQLRLQLQEMTELHERQRVERQSEQEGFQSEIQSAHDQVVALQEQVTLLQGENEEIRSHFG